MPTRWPAASREATVSEALGEVTIDVRAAQHRRGLRRGARAGYDFLCDLAATDYLGFGGEGVAGYWASPSGAGARDINHPASSGLGVVVSPPRHEALRDLLPAARSLGPARAPPAPAHLGGRRRVACRASSASSRARTTRSARPGISWGSTSATHPHLERIFLPEGWDGHPHRKDYPIGGEPVQFSDEV